MLFNSKKSLFVGYFILISASLVLNEGFSQVREYEVPNIIPPSPTASAFARYDDIPVDISTGVPQITIPLYTIKSKRLEIPLVLSYHASGIKVNDVATPIGLGWVISGMTGLVSRTVLDRPDEDYIRYGNETYGRAMYPSEESFQTKVADVEQTNSSFIDFGSQLFEDIKYKDKQADRYNFQLPGSGSGTFRYDFITGELVILPYKPVKISQGPLVNHEIPSFTIVDESGTKYIFNKPYKSSQVSGNYCSYCYNGTANTSWYLTRIESADGTDVIQYQYSTGINAYTTGNFSDTFVWGIFDPSYGGNYSDKINPMLSENNRSYQFTTMYEPLLSRIVSSTAIVQFNYSNDRTDMPDAPFRLSDVKVTDPITGKTIKTLTFDNNHYFGESEYMTSGEELWGGKRLSLKGITINDARGGNTYTFGYIPGHFPPYNTLERKNTNQKLNFAEDFWGYYNGRNTNTGLVPLEFINAPIYNGFPHYLGNRRPNTEFAKIWTLNEITYPTGGKSQFFYEGNMNMSHAVGGLRIQKIINTDNETSSSKVKTYFYSGGYSPRLLNEQLFSYTQYYNWDFEGCGNPDEYNGAWSPQMQWPDVSMLPKRYTTNSSSFCSLTLSSGASVIYTRVKESILDTETDENIGTIEYTFGPPEYPVLETYDRMTGGYWHDVGSYAPSLLKKTVLKKLPSGSYVPVQETLNTYSPYFNNDYHMGIEVFQVSFDINIGTGSHIETGYLIGQSCSEVINPAYDQDILFMHVLRLNNHTATTKVALLTQTIENQYDGNDTISTVTDIEYNLSNLQPSLKRTTSSDGSVLTMEYKYPVDYPSDPVYQQMVSRNIITPVIEARTNKDDDFLQSTKTNFYQGWPSNSNLILPKTVESKTGTNAEEIRVRYHEYDNKGNVLRVSKENDLQQSFIWGYNQSLPIAKVANAQTKDIFHTSFEEGAFNVNVPAKTGVKNSGGQFSKELTTLANGEYQLSYWKYEGSPAKWIQHFEDVTISNSSTGSNGTYTISLPGIIDEIRFHPTGSQMTTFTYQPLVGVTSSTDPAGQTTYYEYDHEGRLSTIRDNEHKILKKTGYSYRGSPEDLIEGAYYNHVRYGRFTPNNCESGYIGTQYTYRVPAYKHSSLVSQEDADFLAQNDINDNGQTQANLHGVCIPAFANTEQSDVFQVNNCSNGFTGVFVTYTVYAGRHRATTQEEANQMALQDIADNGQAYANQVGICYDSSLPFVKLTFENQTVQTVPYGTNGQQFDNVYQDVVINFYADPGRTVPISVTNLQIKLKRNWYLNNQHGTENPTFTVSGTSAVLYNDLLFWGYDTNGDFHEEAFSVMAGTNYNTH